MIIRSFEPAGVFRSVKDKFPDDLPQVAFTGRSNVGKSSLINRLAGRKRTAPTSSTPGKTRSIQFFKVNDSFYLVDLPGYGYARLPLEQRERWRKTVENYLGSSRGLRGVVSLIDIRHKLFDSDRLMLEYLAASRIPALVVLTKADKLGRGRQKQMATGLLQELGGLVAREQVITVSAVQGTGCESLLEAIGELVAEEIPGPESRPTVNHSEKDT
ncbi:MAG: YihA family ribosome biogenesis GTP-binding protein [Candidatus Glassbacteria bacterium]|nr:YihA family ribosome biogenesis GTP-binding protein [Candidatus Glassbacteria bacterium]